MRIKCDVCNCESEYFEYCPICGAINIASTRVMLSNAQQSGYKDLINKGKDIIIKETKDNIDLLEASPEKEMSSKAYLFLGILFLCVAVFSIGAMIYGDFLSLVFIVIGIVFGIFGISFISISNDKKQRLLDDEQRLSSYKSNLNNLTRNDNLTVSEFEERFLIKTIPLEKKYNILIKRHLSDAIACKTYYKKTQINDTYFYRFNLGGIERIAITTANAYEDFVRPKREYFEGNNEFYYYKYNEMRKIDSEMIKLKSYLSLAVSDILFYQKVGDVQYTTNVSGGGFSLGGAIVGDIVGGDTGAIIGSREPIKTETVKHDTRETIVRTKTQELHYPIEWYDKLLEIMPEKDYQYILTHSNN